MYSELVLILTLVIFKLWQRGRDFVDSMAARLIGQVGKFVEGQEEWSQYAERVDHFVANDVDGAEKKRAVFLSLIGPRCYK